MRSESEFLVDVLGRLNAAGVDHMLTGSMASNYWNSLNPSDRQIGDAAGVYAVQAAALDSDYLQRWVPAIGVQADLDALIAGRIRPKTT
ncbi:MAG: hypothetical protein A2V70_09925 [Planctomycetes bacterium RBG_13_63_9]|nr:MAG: hypothetical protein A2V70_09925 [Planctomycetes bacterium RBG_13_63_9]